jgi:hypothetical protein
MGHLHGYGRNLHDANGSYQCFKDFASSIIFGESHLTGLARGSGQGPDVMMFLSAYPLTIYTHVLYKGLKRYDISGESAECMVEHRR